MKIRLHRVEDLACQAVLLQQMTEFRIVVSSGTEPRASDNPAKWRIEAIS